MYGGLIERLWKMKMTEIPEGAVKVHMYDYKNVLRPRGGAIQKESLSAYVLDRLEGAFEDWTNEAYGDNPSIDDLIFQLHTNLLEETMYAWHEFTRRKGKEDASII